MLTLSSVFKNKCGEGTVQDFGVITENIPCGSTGTTCSKSVRIKLGVSENRTEISLQLAKQLVQRQITIKCEIVVIRMLEYTVITYLSWQRTELKLSHGSYEVTETDEGVQIKYNVRNVGLYLVVESAIGLSILWDRKTTVRIILEPHHMVSWISHCSYNCAECFWLLLLYCEHMILCYHYWIYLICLTVSPLCIIMEEYERKIKSTYSEIDTSLQQTDIIWADAWIWSQKLQKGFYTPLIVNRKMP